MDEHRNWRLLTLTLAAALTIGVTEVSADDVEVLCWSQFDYDFDRDGYAVSGAPASALETRDTSSQYQLTCPPGWVLKAGDCDDTNRDIHPRRLEVGANGVDDDCNALADEPSFRYSATGYDNRVDGFKMQVRINDSATLSAHETPLGIAYRVEYQTLRDTSVVHATSYEAVDELAPGGIATLHLGGLEAGTLYRARVQFYRVSLSLQRWGFGSTISQIRHTPVGAHSEWFYTMTDGTHALGRARTRMVLRALAEAHLSAVGYTGYLGFGQVDGTRYGADVGENWCSEYYSYVADFQLKGMGHRSNVAKIVAYFQYYDRYYEGDPPPYFQYWALPGDYLAMFDSATGPANHSGLFLAYDVAKNLIWSVDGNTGNESTVVPRMPAVVKGLGYLGQDMLP